MSIQVRIPEEITDYKESIVAGLSLRELICGTIALGCGLPVYFLLSDYYQNLATILTMITVVPAFAVGFIRPQGYKFEEYVKIRLAAEFMPSKRSYKINTDLELIPYEVLKYRELALSLQAEYGEKEEENAHKSKAQKRRQKKHKYTECRAYQSSKKDFERKRKAALISIKAARKSCSRKECKTQKAASE